jgi:hypothetical protein
MHASKILRWISFLLIAFVWIGCDRPSGSGGSDPATQPSQEALVVLARADALDGAEDRVVSKCLTCSLGMSGHAKHASQFGPYELHLCSLACKKSFDADPEQAVLTVKFPASPD